MSAPAIICENLSKRYRLGERAPYHRFTDLLMGLAGAPWRVARGLASPDVAKANSRAAGQDTAGSRDPWFWALKGVSFQVQRGEVIGIIGRNGAGKSTLLKLLSRITEPTEGQIRLRGRVGSLLEVGTGFHPELTGRENIYLNGAILGMPQARIRSQFDEIVAFAETEKFLDTPVKHYSSGMYMRLAFAVAAHLEPDTLIVDEVLAVGDAAFQKKCLGKMGDVASRGRTVLFVSHNMLAIRGLCGRCVWLNQGRVVADGPTAQVVDRYINTAISDLPESLDTDTLPRPLEDLGREMRFTRVRISGHDGRAKVWTWKPLVVELEAQVTTTVEEVAVGFTVLTMEGLRVFQCLNTNRGGSPLPRLEPGVHRLRATVESLELPPGRYYLDIGARAAGKGLDWLANLMIFEVEESEPPASLWMAGIDGAMRQPSRWEVERVK